ncbi:MAG TPA: hypothetical protein VGB03_06465 [Acidimicrobiales bacterium]|jgi:hypothetical protein
MATALATAGGSRVRARRGLVAVPLMAVLAVAALVMLRDGGNGAATPAARQAVLDYHQAVHPLAVEWGKVEILGMRPAIGDLLSGEGVPAETIAGEARHWQATLASLRERLAAVPVPDGLAEAARLFDASVAEYEKAARTFETAASTEGTARQQGIERGIDQAKAGARLYNEASMKLQTARKLVGLGPTEDFPNQPAAR